MEVLEGNSSEKKRLALPQGRSLIDILHLSQNNEHSPINCGGSEKLSTDSTSPTPSKETAFPTFKIEVDSHCSGSHSHISNCSENHPRKSSADTSLKSLFHKRGLEFLRRGSAPNLNLRTSHGSPHPFRALISRNASETHTPEHKSSAGSMYTTPPEAPSKVHDSNGRSVKPGRLKVRSHSWVGVPFSHRPHSREHSGEAVVPKRMSQTNCEPASLSVKEKLKEFQQLNALEYKRQSSSNATLEKEHHPALKSEYQKFIESLTRIQPRGDLGPDSSVKTNENPPLTPMIVKDSSSGNVCSFQPSTGFENQGAATVQNFLDEVGPNGDMESDEWYHCSTVRDLEVFRKKFTEEIDCIRERKVFCASLMDIVRALTDISESRRSWDPYFLEATVIEKISNNARILHYKYKNPFLFRPRDFVVLECDYVDSLSNTHYTILNSVQHPKVPETSEYMRGEILVSGFMVKKQNTGEVGSNVDKTTDNGTELNCVTLLWQVNYKYHINHIFGENTSRKDKKFQVNEYDSKLLALERIIASDKGSSRDSHRERSESDALATRLRLLLSLLPSDEVEEEMAPASNLRNSTDVGKGSISKPPSDNDAKKSLDKGPISATAAEDVVRTNSLVKKSVPFLRRAFSRRAESPPMRKVSLVVGADLPQVEEEERRRRRSSALSSKTMDEARIYPFYAMLKDSICRMYFGKFLETEFNSENLDFWIAAETFHKQSQEDSLEEITYYMTDILQKYIVVGSPHQINLCDADRQLIEKAVENWLQDYKLGAKNPPIHVFKYAQSVIATLMKNDPYNRFVESLQYRDMLEYLSENGANLHVRLVENFLRIMREPINPSKATNPWIEYCNGNMDTQVFVKLHMTPFVCIREASSFRIPMTDLLNLFLDLSPERKKWDPLFLRGNIVEEIGIGMHVVCYKFRRPLPFHSPRDACVLRIARQDMSGNFFIVERSIEHRLCPKRGNFPRANILTSGFFIKRDEHDHSLCNVTRLLQIDMKLKTELGRHLYKENWKKSSLLASLKKKYFELYPFGVKSDLSQSIKKQSV